MPPSASHTTSSLSATKSSRSPGCTSRRSLSFAFSASGKNFSIEPVSLSPSAFRHASPLALNVAATLGSSPPGLRAVLENLSAAPFALIARTTPPRRDRFLEERRTSLSLAMSVTSTISSPKRRSGLSRAVLQHRVRIRQPRERQSGSSTPRHFSKISAARPSITPRTSSCSTNDISTSSCVNSGWRSARRSSSRRQRGDLEVLVVARDHQQLLVQLRRLRQREELAVEHAARHEVIAGPFRRALAQERRLDFEEAARVEIVADHLVDAVPQDRGCAEATAAAGRGSGTAGGGLRSPAPRPGTR